MARPPVFLWSVPSRRAYSPTMAVPAYPGDSEAEALGFERCTISRWRGYVSSTFVAVLEDGTPIAESVLLSRPRPAASRPTPRPRAQRLRGAPGRAGTAGMGRRGRRVDPWYEAASPARSRPWNRRSRPSRRRSAHHSSLRRQPAPRAARAATARSAPARPTAPRAAAHPAAAGRRRATPGARASAPRGARRPDPHGRAARSWSSARSGSQLRLPSVPTSSSGRAGGTRARRPTAAVSAPTPKPSVEAAPRSRS